ncbi:hypothetical protein LLE87_27765, partial [Paenibacillus polymyxa]|nr:hypothetical protein [Paenibacillus polymyxa]
RAVRRWRRPAPGPRPFPSPTPNAEKLPALNILTRSGSDQERAAQEALTAVPLPDPSTQAKGVQEPGVRYSRALPYELHASGRSQPGSGTTGNFTAQAMKKPSISRYSTP